MLSLRPPRLIAPLACAAAFLSSFTWGRAQDAPEGYTTRLWQTEDGLPVNAVSAVVQTRDGYLWVGTYSGLARFDGVRFRTFDALNTPALRDARIMSLYEAPDGVLWIGHDSGRVTRYAGGRFETPESVSPQAAERVVAISSDEHGAIWVLRDSGSLESVDGRRVVAPPERAGKPQVLALARDADGRLFIDQDGTVSQLVGDTRVTVDFGPAQHTGFVIGLGAGRTSGVWFARDWVLEKRVKTSITERRGSVAWGDSVSVTTIVEMRNGCLAVGTVNRGLFLFSPDRPPVHFDHRNGLPQDWVRSIDEDREGNLWLGVGSGGLVEVVPTPISVLSPPEGWGGRTELALAADRGGALWIGTEGAGLYRYHEGRWAHYAQPEGLEHPFVWSVVETNAGMLAGTWGGGIFRLRGDRFERVPEYDPNVGPVFALEYAAKWKELWIAGGGGLMRWPEGGVPETVETGVAATRYCTVVRDDRGVVWFGGPGTGLGRLEGGRVTHFHTADGLASDSVICLLAGENGALWIGTSFGGLVRFKDGRFATISVEQGLPNNVICHIADDGRGFLWLSTHRGLVRIAKAELDRCADGHAASVAVQVFDRNDGLPTVEFSAGLHAAGCATPDGRLWFPTSKGVVGVNPALIHSNPVPPPVVLEAVQVDGHVQERMSEALTDLHLEPDHERLEFQFTALSLTAPGKVQFKYRLEGIDQHWVDAGAKRSASYSRLPAGRYVFRVIASNNDGVWNRDGAAITCVVRPFFWQTWWFVSGSILVALGLVAGLARQITRRRMQRRVEELERRNAVERERARIARDIHDDIGATLTRITMLSQCLPRGAAPAEQGAPVVEQIYTTAREATRALDEIVWAVNPRHDSLEGLVSYMAKFAQDYLAAAGVRCRLDVPVKLPEWAVTAEVRHNLFLAFKEALNNTVKHAHATEVCVALQVEDAGFELILTDNGAGFDPSAPSPSAEDRPASGNGLENLQRRLASIGGRCELTSAPGAGTRVSFVIRRRAGEGMP